jgi:hypothetical protein
MTKGSLRKSPAQMAKIQKAVISALRKERAPRSRDWIERRCKPATCFYVGVAIEQLHGSGQIVMYRYGTGVKRYIFAGS